MTYGYARCNHKDNISDIDKQKIKILSLGVSNDAYIFFDCISGLCDEQPELLKLIKLTMPGDTIVITDISRLTRSMTNLLNIFRLLKDKDLILNIDGKQYKDFYFLPANCHLS